MGKRILIVAVVLLLFAGGLTWLGLRSQIPDPTYQGKRLSAWLDEYWIPVTNGTTFSTTVPSGSTVVFVQNNRAVAAVRQMGTNAVPFLLRRLSEKNWPFVQNLKGLAQRWHILKRSGAYWDRRQGAAFCLAALGSNARDAVPTLIKIYDANKEPMLRMSIPRIFQNVGTAASNAVPSLLRVAADTNEPDYVRLPAIDTLEILHADPKVFVPMLAKNLHDRDPKIRESAAYELGLFGAKAGQARSDLLQALTDSDAVVREHATNALERISPEAAPTAGMKQSSAF